jgi:hypothetical protein
MGRHQVGTDSGTVQYMAITQRLQGTALISRHWKHSVSLSVCTVLAHCEVRMMMSAVS